MRFLAFITFIINILGIVRDTNGISISSRSISIVEGASLHDFPIPPGKSDPTHRVDAKPDGDISWYQPTCQLGLYENEITNVEGAWWEGEPLGFGAKGPDTPYNMLCTNIKDLNPKLAGTLSAYRLTGYCECEFYAPENCAPESTRFRAYNRQDGALGADGKQDDNDILSIKC
ncbi:hypothetical protein H072_6243 [Dactylellina haptotyla CBS 200.50]|uniref:Uncharacterized protein n=1 Tax=Dactylellina haptotyla (strain CBS 200.50) TaxID=1284197 RepID=S8BWW1_DACHA|nr:hypothetical protein H072_6243 [Dactylellina haptotyla CBS 200.50]